MAAALTPTLAKHDFQNWIKGALAVLFAKEGIEDFVEQEIADFQRDLFLTVYTQSGIPCGTTCNLCTTANVLACPTEGFCNKGKKCKAHNPKGPDKIPNKACPNGLCTAIRDGIRNEHRFHDPSWKNTDTRRWCSDAYEISKCFMPRDGYSDKTCLAETDFNGVLAIVINSKRFQTKLSVNLRVEPNICTEARIIGRAIRHSANHLLSEQDLMKYIDDLITLLSDPAYLAADAKAKDGVVKLKQLKSNTLMIHAGDITNVLNDNIKTTFDEYQNAFILDLQKHLKTHEHDSVAVIDRKIQELVVLQNKHLDDLKAYTKRSKHELRTQSEQIRFKVSSRIRKLYLEYREKTRKTLDETTVLYTRILDTKKDESIRELQEVTKSGKKDLESCAKQNVKRINNTIEPNAGESDEKLFKEFKEELIMHYQARESTIPLSPLVENHDTLLEEFYVQPPLLLIEKPHPLRGIKDESNTDQHRNYDEGFKHGLITLHRARESSIEQPLEIQDSDNSTKILISCYRDLFRENEKDLYKNIYVSAQAGMGKTSFSRKLAMDWCKAQVSKSTSGNVYYVKGEVENCPIKRNDTVKNKHYDSGKDDHKHDTKVDISEDSYDKTNGFKHDISTLLSFEFLFLLHLRDYQGNGECYVEDMLCKMITDYFVDSRKYSKIMLQKILQEKRCLVVLDGLDEWCHPERSCTRNERTPHMKAYKMCTTLTLTRPWKMSTIGLTTQQIDIHVEITRLNEKKIHELGNNALNILNKRYKANKETKTLYDFLNKMIEAESGEIITIPYVLLQFICLWHDGREIGRNRCEIYSNIIDFTLERGMKKAALPDPSVSKYGTKIKTPMCMLNAKACNSHIHLISQLGKLAFFSLFNNIKESTLIIDSDTVLKYIDKKELEFFLKTGLLSQSKDSNIVSKESLYVYYHHKSIQEFFAALYISFTWHEKKTKEIFRNALISRREIIEFSSVVSFVCGVNDDVYASLSRELQAFVAHDSIAQKYRQLEKLSRTETTSSKRDTLLSYRSQRFCPVPNELWEYQSTQLSCFKENGRNNDRINLQDIIILDLYMYSDYFEDLRKLAECNETNIKSILVSTYNISFTVEHILKRVHAYLSLESLFWNSRNIDLLVYVLDNSAGRLKYISITEEFISLSISNVIKRLCNLERIYLYVRPPSEFKLSRPAFFGRSDRNNNCPGCSLDLSELSKLQRLHLPHSINLRNLHVNTKCLEELELSAAGFSASATSIILAELQGAPVLSSLTMCNIKHVPDILVKTIPTLVKLRRLTLKSIDLSDNALSLPLTMTKLEHLALSEVIMKAVGWKELISSVGRLSESVTVELEYREGPSKIGWDIEYCERPSKIEWDVIFTALRLLPCQILKSGPESIHFQTIKQKCVMK